MVRFFPVTNWAQNQTASRQSNTNDLPIIDQL